jgi:hypothetical protein
MDLEHCLHWLHSEPTHQDSNGFIRYILRGGGDLDVGHLVDVIQRICDGG